MVADIIRDSFFGGLCRFVTAGKIFKYPEELQIAIWQRYIDDDDAETVGFPQPPLKCSRRNLLYHDKLPANRDISTEEIRHLQCPPIPPEIPEPLHLRDSVRPSEESVTGSAWAKSRPSGATLAQERSSRPSLSTETRCHFRPASHPSRSVGTLIAPVDESPPVSPKTQSKGTTRRNNADGDKSVSWWQDNAQDAVSQKDNDYGGVRKSADVKSYFIGLELFRYISAMIYFGSDHTVTVTSTRYPPGSVKRPNYIQKGRTKHGRPLRSDEYPLKDLRRSDVEHGLDDSGELLPSDDATGLGDWEVERQAGLYVVGWYGPNDQENPKNWSTAKKCFVTFEICLLTFAVYVAAAIYSSAVVDVEHAFDVPPLASIAGLSLFVAGFALGPMLWSPMSEVPAIGRTNIYIITLAVFVALQVPTFLATNFATLLVMRFLAGFIGSPAFATGGASVAEIFNPAQAPYAIAVWGIFAACGPTVGPLVGGVAVEARGWTWSILIVLWVSGLTFIILFFLLPETSAAAILHKRTIRLRKLTGNTKLVCKADIASHGRETYLREVLRSIFVRPFIVSFTEPIVLVLNLYVALLYGLLYLWLESFPIVFGGIYGFGLETSGFMFSGLLAGDVVTLLGYLWWLRTSLKPKIAKHRKFVPEWMLPPCYVGAPAVAISLFLFGWTSREDIHWIVPVIGTSFFAVALVLLMNSILNYLVLSYPTQAATVLAGNAMVRSLLAASFPIFGTNIYDSLGIAWGTSVLGFVAAVFVSVPFILIRYGPWLRSKSRLMG